MHLLILLRPFLYLQVRATQDSRRDATRFLTATLVQNAMAQHCDARMVWLKCHEVEGHMNKKCSDGLEKDWGLFDTQRKKVCCFHRSLQHVACHIRTHLIRCCGIFVNTPQLVCALSLNHHWHRALA